jgi:hypothetical protein
MRRPLSDMRTIHCGCVVRIMRRANGRPGQREASLFVDTGLILNPGCHQVWARSILLWYSLSLTDLESPNPALAMDALQRLDDGRLALETPPDPRTGVTRLALDPLEWIHRITAHIPDARRHCQRYYGAYSNRARAATPSAVAQSASPTADPPSERDHSQCSREARSEWAHLLRKIFEADPLVCSCGTRMRIVSFITDPRVVDRILHHRNSERCKTEDPFEPRAPPRSGPHTLQ